MHFILIHGYNDKSGGDNNIDRAAPYLRELGHTVDTDKADYGWVGLLWVRFRKHSAVLRIVEAIEQAHIEGKDVAVMAYSNGANYALKALRLVTTGTVKLVLVHPAAKRNADFPDSVCKAWVCFTRSDWAVRFASYIAWLVPGWGRMGYKGYRGDDQRVTNLDFSDVAKRHGGLWKPNVVDWFSRRVNSLVMAA